MSHFKFSFFHLISFYIVISNQEIFILWCFSWMFLFILCDYISLGKYLFSFFFDEDGHKILNRDLNVLYSRYTILLCYFNLDNVLLWHFFFFVLFWQIYSLKKSGFFLRQNVPQQKKTPKTSLNHNNIWSGRLTHQVLVVTAVYDYTDASIQKKVKNSYQNFIVIIHYIKNLDG